MSDWYISQQFTPVSFGGRSQDVRYLVCRGGRTYSEHHTREAAEATLRECRETYENLWWHQDLAFIARRHRAPLAAARIRVRVKRRLRRRFAAGDMSALDALDAIQHAAGLAPMRGLDLDAEHNEPAGYV